jgi:hypothetical protein
MADVPPQDTHQNALVINLDPTTFGTLAEIGGRERLCLPDRRRAAPGLTSGDRRMFTVLDDVQAVL